MRIIFDSVSRPSPAIAQEITTEFAPSLAPSRAEFYLPTAAMMYQIPSNRDTSLVDEFQQLAANWDGYDADPISGAACEAAKQLIVSLPGNLESPELCPNPNGTISMEWESDEGDAQLELGRTRYSFYLRRRGSPTIYHKGDLSGAASAAALLIALRGTSRPSNNINSVLY